jgi:excinuclease ABC subunit A
MRMAANESTAPRTGPPYREIEGLDLFDKVVDIDQSPIGRTPRSNPATYTGLFTPLRELFAQVPEARARGYERRALQLQRQAAAAARPARATA